MKIALISDIHEHIINLELALKKIEKLGCSEIICLGDISGYSAPYYNYFNTRNASKCLQIIKESCSTIIAGNHDLHAIKKTPSPTTLFTYPKNWYKLNYYERQKLSDNSVWLYENDELNPLYTNNDIDFIKTLTEFKTANINEHKALFSHYCYPNLTGSSKVFYGFSDDLNEHFNFMEQHKCTVSFVGHQHFPGLTVAAKNQLTALRFGKQYKVTKNNCIFVPPITTNKRGSGFCLYNSTEQTVKAVKI